MVDQTSQKTFDVEKIRKDFPILSKTVYDKPLVYLDNAATSQKPQVVIDAVNKFYCETNSNIHRSVFCLSEQATKDYERTRHHVQSFINAKSSKEVIFVKGTTEAINLVAQSYGRTFLQEGDEILITEMEHHSNIVPWQLLCEQTGAKLQVTPLLDDGSLDMAAFQKLLNVKTKFVAVAHVSNSLGTVNDIKKMIELAHAQNTPVMIDGAQAVSHMRVDVQELDCDFYVFSGHKMFGPTGVGILYGKEDVLERMPPYQGGGDMIRTVTFEETTFNTLPYKFEAGTPNIAGVIGLGVAMDYLREIDFEAVHEHEEKLLRYATERLLQIDKLKIIGNAPNKASLISFVLEEAHAQDIGTILDRRGVAVRAGHHCAMPVMKRFGVPATTRASFAFYNTKQEVDIFVDAIESVVSIFK